MLNGGFRQGPAVTPSAVVLHALSSPMTAAFRLRSCARALRSGKSDTRRNCRLRRQLSGQPLVNLRVGFPCCRLAPSNVSSRSWTPTGTYWRCWPTWQGGGQRFESVRGLEKRPAKRVFSLSISDADRRNHPTGHALSVTSGLARRSPGPSPVNGRSLRGPKTARRRSRRDGQRSVRRRACAARRRRARAPRRRRGLTRGPGRSRR